MRIHVMIGTRKNESPITIQVLCLKGFVYDKPSILSPGTWMYILAI